MKQRIELPGAVVASVVLHAALLGAGAWLLARSLSAPAEEDAGAVLVEVEGSEDDGTLRLPAMSRFGITGVPEPRAEPVPRQLVTHGGERTARPDLGVEGGGGTDEAHEAALNLADEIDGLTLDRELRTSFEQSQVQRLRTSTVRASLDDRRATPNPMELAFLATGVGSRAERREPSELDPSQGSASGSVDRAQGSRIGGPDGEEGEAPVGGRELGGREDSVGLGVVDGPPGRRFTRRARVALARPLVPEARAAVPANRRQRPNDTADSSQEVASAVAALVHASSAGGPRGSGPGGTAGPAAPGSGTASGRGSISESSGSGPGATRTSGPGAHLHGYIRAMQARVDPFWERAFPDWAIAEGRGGVAVLRVTVLADGSLRGIEVVRPSGTPEFDTNLVQAIRRAAPFPPPPRALGPPPLPFHFSFDATNPAVGRDGPGNGRRR